MDISHLISRVTSSHVTATGLAGYASWTDTNFSSTDASQANGGLLIYYVIYPHYDPNAGPLFATLLRSYAGNTAVLTSLGRLKILTSISTPNPDGGGGTWCEVFYLLGDESAYGTDLTSGSPTVEVRITGHTYPFTGTNIIVGSSLYSGSSGIANLVGSSETIDDFALTVSTGQISSWAAAFFLNFENGGGGVFAAGANTVERASYEAATRNHGIFDSNAASGGASYTLNFDQDSVAKGGAVGFEILSKNDGPPAQTMIFF